MALKGDRHELMVDLSSICNDVCVKGDALFWTNGLSPSGSALDDANNIVTLLTSSPSGRKIAGISLVNTVNIDTTRQHVNFHKDEVVIGSHVTILRQGWVVTDRIVASAAPVAGDKVYASYSGLLSNTVLGGGNVGPIGEWMHTKRSEGVARSTIHLRAAGPLG